MSIGADLGAMDSLAARFVTAGGNFKAETGAISTTVGDALEAFTTEMKSLEIEAVTLSDEIAAEMSTLNSKAQATTWTGANADKMNVAVGELDDSIVAIKGNIDSFVGEASGVVNGSLANAMSDLSTTVDTAGTRAQTTAENFNSGVAAQRNAFDQVMNG